jgi:Protein of unknown function (DUF1566)
MVHLFKTIIYRTIVVTTVLLASCSGQDTSQSIGLDGNSKSPSNSTKTLSATADTGGSSLANANAGASQLLASLASQYPNGKLPDNRAAESAKLLAQNPRVFKKAAQLSHFSPSDKLNTAGYQTQSIRGSGDYMPVYRYQLASQYGTYLLSKFAISSKSLAQIINPNFLPEGTAFEVSEAYQLGLSPVYRFRNVYNNTQIDTIDAGDRDYIIANYSNYFAYEGTAWHASTSPISGWLGVARFYNLTNGSYLYTSDTTEINEIYNSYSQVFEFDGFVYFVKPLSPTTPPTYVSIFPKVATQNVKTDFVVEGTNVPLDAQLSFASFTCETPTSRTTTGFSQKCTMGSGATAQARVIANAGAKQLGYTQIELFPAIVEPVYTGNLPDTGITNMQCYGAGSDALISCTSPAAIALNSKQDGMVGRDVTVPAAADGKLGFSYSDVPKLGGGVYAKTECVKDNITGLTWEGKTSSGLRSYFSEYTNYDSTAKAQKWDGNNQVNPTQVEIDAMTNTLGYKNYVNSIALCGYTDWRLPAVNELDGLLDAVANAYGYFDTTWFPNTWINARYWSSTNAANPSTNSNPAWYLNMSDSKINTVSRDGNLNVKLVRGGAASTVSRYSYINNGTEVVDSKTGLTWKRCEEGMAWNGNTCIGTSNIFTHEQALVQANTQAGWRLPNRKELTGIQDFSRYPAIDPLLFPTNVEFPSYWSSTPNGDNGDSIWSVSFYVGAYLVGRQYQGLQIRLVRNSP